MKNTLLNIQDKWRNELKEWALPARITDQLEDSTFRLSPESFAPEDSRLDTPTMRQALHILNSNGTTLLDVGAAAGSTSLILIPPAKHITVVDQNSAMLDMLRENAIQRNIKPDSLTIIHSDWPCDTELSADVVLNANVLYNVSEPVPFINSLIESAKMRAIIEVTEFHPHHSMNHIYAALHGFQRPNTPTYVDILSMIEELGFTYQVECFERSMNQISSQNLDAIARRASIERSRMEEFQDFVLKNPIKPTSVYTITIDR